MTNEARKILATPLCHVDERTLRRLLKEEVERGDRLEKELRAPTNYVANDEVGPTYVEFANGHTDMKIGTPHD